MFVRRLPLFNRNTHPRMHTHLVSVLFFFFFLYCRLTSFSSLGKREFIKRKIEMRLGRNLPCTAFAFAFNTHNTLANSMSAYIVCANPAFTTPSSLSIAFSVLTDESVNYYGLALFVLLHFVSSSHFVCVHSAWIVILLEFFSSLLLFFCTIFPPRFL